MLYPPRPYGDESGPGPLHNESAPGSFWPIPSSTTARGVTADEVRQIVREELERAADEARGSRLVPQGEELRRLYRDLTGQDMGVVAQPASASGGAAYCIHQAVWIISEYREKHIL